MEKGECAATKRGTKKLANQPLSPECVNQIGRERAAQGIGNGNRFDRWKSSKEQRTQKIILKKRKWGGACET